MQPVWPQMRATTVMLAGSAVEPVEHGPLTTDQALMPTSKLPGIEIQAPRREPKSTMVAWICGCVGARMQSCFVVAVALRWGCRESNSTDVAGVDWMADGNKDSRCLSASFLYAFPVRAGGLQTREIASAIVPIPPWPFIFRRSFGLLIASSRPGDSSLAAALRVRLPIVEVRPNSKLRRYRLFPLPTCVILSLTGDAGLIYHVLPSQLRVMMKPGTEARRRYWHCVRGTRAVESRRGMARLGKHTLIHAPIHTSHRLAGHRRPPLPNQAD